MVPRRHALEQGPMIRALGGLALSMLARRAGSSGAPQTPGPWTDAELLPRSPSLVKHYIDHVGGDPGWYAGLVPAHMFPQWAFPLLMRTLRELPYPYARAVNAGCRIEQHGPIPAREPLLVRARTESIDDDGRRALITQRLITGTLTAPDAMSALVRVLIPLRSGPRGARKAPPVVPPDASSLASVALGRGAALDFALLTGDFNPIHWVRPYAKLAGFPSTILHGFASLARAIEALNRGLFAGDPMRLRMIDVRFTKPLVLPALVSVYTSADGGVWVGGDQPSEAYLEGRFEGAAMETPR